MFKNRLELVKNMMHLNFDLQVPVACFSCLVLTFLKHFACLGFFIIWVFFKVNSGDFLHNRVATLLKTQAEPYNVTKVRNCFLWKPWWSWWDFATG